MSEPLSTRTAVTTTPLIQNRHRTRLQLSRVEPGATDNGPILKFQWRLQDEAPSNIPGRTIKPGDFAGIITETIFMYAKADATDPTNFVTKISARIDALLGTDVPNNPFGKPERPEAFMDGATLENNGTHLVFRGSLNPEVLTALVGKEAIVEMRITKDNRDNSDRQELGKLTYPGDIKA